ncbi:DUF2927 domain-containing protein [Thiomicrorhabdus arctica]|uniref:DUF2927 domain-containing protein n=1 Tax=Thiomicrorhabdus arctica TaxID=131540 RepID=UPI000376CA4F|nr:DUF2927 domain-containing protein [Thiomicrorhabdus arctica]
MVNIALKDFLGYKLTFLLVILFWIPASSANEQMNAIEWQSPSYIQKAFNEIALKNEYRKTQQRIIKWQKPIFYKFVYHNLPQNPVIERLFNRHLQHLQQITQHPIQLISNEKLSSHRQQKPNLHIHLTKDTDYGRVIQQVSKSKVRNIERESHCMGSFTLNAQHQIEQAVVIIPVDHVYSRGLLVTCIVEETTQIMGLPNDSDWVNPSIANDASRIELLTGLDYLLLKILYDSKLQAGMRLSQSEPIIKNIINEFQKKDLIKNAQQQVNKQGLYPLLN